MDSPAFEGKQRADRAVNGRVQQDLCSAGNKGRPLEGSHYLSDVELRAEEYKFWVRGRTPNKASD